MKKPFVAVCLNEAGGHSSFLVGTTEVDKSPIIERFETKKEALDWAAKTILVNLSVQYVLIAKVETLCSRKPWTFGRSNRDDPPDIEDV